MTTVDRTIVTEERAQPESEPDDSGSAPANVAAGSKGRWVTAALSFVVVASCCIFVFFIVHPELIFLNTTPTGGDMGSHVWGPAYLRDHLLTQGRLTGWTQDWYAGFPAYGFYMVVPSLAIVALDVGLLPTTGVLGGFCVALVLGASLAVFVLNRIKPGARIRKLAVGITAGLLPILLLDIPYNVAFKMIVVSGIVAFPAAVWYLMKGLSLRQPGPELAAVFSLGFLMDKSLFHIYGGNIASTMAGEFAFSISLTLSLFALGVAARGLRDGKRMALGAVLLAVATLCHVIPAIFVTVAAVLLFGLRPSVRGFVWAICAGFTAVCLAVWWYLPFGGRSEFLNDMGWEKLAIDKAADGAISTNWDQVRRYLLPFAPHDLGGTPLDDPNMLHGKFFFVLAAVGIFLSLVYVVRSGIWLTLVMMISAVAFVYMPQARFWNARILPFYYLAIYLLAAVGVTLLIRTLVLLVAGRWVDIPKYVGIPVATAAVVVMISAQLMTLRAMPGGSLNLAADGSVDSYQWLFFKQKYEGVVNGWAEWNFSGLERKGSGVDGYYEDSNEFFGMINEMDRVGKENGCGRAMWEYNSDINSYGTPMAPMMLPYFTDSCIGSMEGLYFEASSTTFFHFIVQSELSESPSRPQRHDHLGFEESPYPDFDMAGGIDHLQMMGVKYYMAKTTKAKDAAALEPRLTLVGTSDPWQVYEIADTTIVEPLENLPVVWNDVENGIEEWARPAMDWWNDRSVWDVERAVDGPESGDQAWDRISWEKGDAIPVTAAPSPDLTVSNVEMGDDSLSFDVDQIGSPVLVKMSYFPNWNVEGADGPYRVAPNFMVVVPTAEHVSFTYGVTPLEYVAWGITGLGLILLVALALKPPLKGRDEDEIFEFFGDRDPLNPDDVWENWPDDDPAADIPAADDLAADGPEAPDGEPAASDQ